jgi:TDG/mug DNA glycosylase family protein
MRNTLVLKQSFAPFVDTRARILILGTLPGEESLRLQRYYGNPRNLFWRVLADVFAEPHVVEYEQQKALLKRNRIALWDVLHSAERIGSLDSAIRNPVPNDIAKLLLDYPRLRTIAFNGLRAQSLFRQFIAATLTVPPDKLRLSALPSTSPTPSRKAVTYQEKVAQWAAFLNAEGRIETKE